MILPQTCPKCKSDLRSAEEQGKSALGSGNDVWTRAFLIVQHNRAFSFRCPDCTHEWPIPWMTDQPKATDLD